MVNFKIESEEKHRSLWPFLLIGVVVVAVLVVVFGWVERPGPPGPAAKPLPFGAAEQAYAGKVKFENLKMSRFANFLNQEVTYIDGDIVNQGDRSIAALAVTVEFRNIENKVVMRQTQRPLSEQAAPIAPGERRSFRLAFEQIPDDWNMQYPKIQVTGLVLR
ncbi:MAG: DUF2393 family protein [Acidobacteriota bacterium]|nr:DUF2393 family protein [Acidobacteriota bacterium]